MFQGTDTLDLSIKRKSGETGESDFQGDGQGNVPKDTVLVLDAKSKLGEEVVLQMILKGIKVKTLVRKKEEAQVAFGQYVSCVESSLDDRASLRALLKGVKSVVVTGGMGFDKGQRLMEACKSQEVDQVVLMSSYVKRESFFEKILVKSEQSILEDEEREQMVATSGVPYTIVRGGVLEDSLERSEAIKISRSGKLRGGSVSRSDLAYASVACLDFKPQNTTIELVPNSSSSGPGDDSIVLVESEEDWKVALESELI